MIRARSSTNTPTVAVWAHPHTDLPSRLPSLAKFVLANPPTALSQHPAWLNVLHDGLGHEVYALEAKANGLTCGYLPLALVASRLFGRFLVSLPYLNSNGVVASSPEVQRLLIDKAVDLADDLDVRHLELRHEVAIDHPALTGAMTSKVHMRLALPATDDALWKQLDAKVRNQVRKGEKSGLDVKWGGIELLDLFYSVIARNMRDLGTPVFGRRLFASVLNTFPQDAEICLVSSGPTPIAAALLLHGNGVTEVPTASSLREYNATCCNMLLYVNLLRRSLNRAQQVFDFGRSTADGATFKFKKQWGAVPHPAVWQYHPRDGKFSDMRPENPHFQRLIRLWQRLPVGLTTAVGPAIVRGIP